MKNPEVLSPFLGSAEERKSPAGKTEEIMKGVYQLGDEVQIIGDSLMGEILIVKAGEIVGRITDR